MDIQAVIAAVCEGDLAAVKTLTVDAAPAELAGCDADGYTPLHYGAFFGHTEICQYLISRNAPVGVADNAEKMTPLHMACQQEESTAEIIGLLLLHHAPCDALNTTLENPEHRSAGAEAEGHESLSECRKSFAMDVSNALCSWGWSGPRADRVSSLLNQNLDARGANHGPRNIVQ